MFRLGLAADHHQRQHYYRRENLGTKPSNLLSVDRKLCVHNLASTYLQDRHCLLGRPLPPVRDENNPKPSLITMGRSQTGVPQWITWILVIKAGENRGHPYKNSSRS